MSRADRGCTEHLANSPSPLDAIESGRYVLQIFYGCQDRTILQTNDVPSSSQQLDGVENWASSANAALTPWFK
jgi:hypothetical protein